MNKTLNDLIAKVQETTDEVNQVKQDIKLSLLVLRANHDDRVRTRRNDR